MCAMRSGSLAIDAVERAEDTACFIATPD
jgi:hypothetical protein